LATNQRVGGSNPSGRTKNRFKLEHNLIIKVKNCRPDIYNNYKFIPLNNNAFYHIGMKIEKDPLILPKLYVSLSKLIHASAGNYEPFMVRFSRISSPNWQ
jgi:hypothetical protein